MAAFVDHETAHLTLKALLAETPDEVGAVAAEGRLLEEARDELVILHLVHVLLPQRALSLETSNASRAIETLVHWVGHGKDGSVRNPCVDGVKKCPFRPRACAVVQGLARFALRFPVGRHARAHACLSPADCSTA